MMMYIRNKFEVSSNWISNYLGTPSAFMFACLSILLWAVMGPFSNYSDSWQLVANTFTTLATVAGTAATCTSW
ncbi:MAG: hypothetical protein EOO60_09105 [Hymenobacter sp.]|nr:MAG: hypothetical protein EOO60_09105 [Hymenobacter sp.]